MRSADLRREPPAAALLAGPSEPERSACPELGEPPLKAAAPVLRPRDVDLACQSAELEVVQTHLEVLQADVKGAAGVAHPFPKVHGGVAHAVLLADRQARRGAVCLVVGEEREDAARVEAAHEAHVELAGLVAGKEPLHAVPGAPLRPARAAAVVAVGSPPRLSCLHGAVEVPPLQLGAVSEAVDDGLLVLGKVGHHQASRAVGCRVCQRREGSHDRRPESRRPLGRQSVGLCEGALDVVERSAGAAALPVEVPGDRLREPR
mmetsp:Transcript_17781/g.42661  ORF Transcript_17781/g.42661 Transcript_17781/m.42661 type:complete len:262 (-) Transcript_17781:2209-2994(-)